MSQKNLDLQKAEQAMRQAFDLFQLGSSMLQNNSATASGKKIRTKKSHTKSKTIKKPIVTFDSDSSDSDEDTTPEEGFEIDTEETIKVPKTSDKDFYLKYSDDYINFTAQNPTTFHVVSFFSKLLESRGFKYLSEKEDWTDLTPGLYYTTRSGTNLGAFALGEGWKPEYGAGIIGCHCDSLAGKLKPVSKKSKVDGYELLGVAPYAGALSPAWFDRDLGIAGRVLIRVKDDSSATGYKIVPKLIDSSPKPIARISTLAPHFGAAADPPFNPETQAVPVIAFSPGPDAEPTEKEKKSPLLKNHSLELLRYIAELADVGVEELVQLDLDLFDVQRGTLGGLKDDFLYAPRIDDRICSYSAIFALLEFAEKPIPKGSFNQVLLYDNEEIGSLTRQGAKSTLINSITERVISALYEDSESLTKVSFANSIVLSADVTHLLNPTYKGEYLEHHYALPNIGITIALDPNGHMATDSVGLALVEEIARLNDDKLQYFQIKNGARSGGTIGPSISTETGARTIDLGIAQLSMHSIRAATGSKDVGLGVEFFKHFFQDWRGVYDSFGDL
ncbi:CYFA0S03e04610g1_1 [Cyberlindnera fabianii]|uniref:CYFA0S03e04610g1_1 n=1 Tax=Cyberlindnera fabianii TaxID=36022 RepID=A0A061AQY3_CYBFA|nr:Vacuolar aminopeptidase 1 [Cyberlindnera fabianii]CDR39550.1 CYFA0S03e04610g1_1 [Cyberlindnera fabianii]